MILVVDDCDALRRYIGVVLRRLGYSVIEAANGGAAAEVAQRHTDPIDLLVMDLELPDAGGQDVAQQLIATRPGLPVLYISGYPREILGEEALPPRTGFLQKPFTRDALVAQVREALRKRELVGSDTPQVGGIDGAAWNRRSGTR
ncbi:MAG: response regulator [Bryobacteraceae bacterium]